MVQENELVSLMLTVGVLLFLLSNRGRLRRLPKYRWLMAAFLSFLLVNALTLLEGMLWPETFNFLEHAGHLATISLLGVWIWRTAPPQGEDA